MVKTSAKRKTTKLIVTAGQYEQNSVVVKVRHSTERGLLRRARQLSREHAVYGDNWVGWINADIAIASDNDEWTDCQFIGGQYCDPANGYWDIWDEEE